MDKDAAAAQTEQSKITESHGSSPEKNAAAHTADQKAAVGSTFQLQSRKPTEPPTVPSAFAQSTALNVSVGNADYIAEQRDEGKYGLFLPRDRAHREPEPVTMIVGNFFDGIVRTTERAMVYLLQKKSEFNDIDVLQRVHAVAEQLAIGAMLATYFKLRALIYLDLPDRYTLGSLKRPKAIADLPVIAPFAFAIQQLGYVNVANLTRERRFVPVFPEDDHTFGVPLEHHWNPNLYSQAVDYARTLGLHFNVVDYKKKQGTAWWLLRQHYEDHVFELQVPLPEVNFTSAMAITHTLFLEGEAADPSNAVFDLTPVGADTYGYILREPHFGINVTTYQVIDGSAQEIVSNV
ncbi:putative coat protein [Rose cryptic virus 1]|uniref:putative coat protein n=1 Tax=Rose cryptic virus 1 TaxID=492502 RepID=UPI0001652782|nr:putative coat protein [Rose cryptic virus 1]ABZ10946.1 putative coat protein [Rose cryptic virus 1]